VRGIAFAFPLRNTCFDQAAQGKTVMKGLQNRVLGIFLGIFFSIVIAPALAHDPSHPELDRWFNKLASGKGLCCSFADGYVVADADWETRDGHYKVRIPKVVGSADMEWVDVPDDALITEPNRAGRTMVWPMRFNGEISIRCFMPGSMT
jgi:hypothetical protein